MKTAAEFLASSLSVGYDSRAVSEAAHGNSITTSNETKLSSGRGFAGTTHLQQLQQLQQQQLLAQSSLSASSWASAHGTVTSMAQAEGGAQSSRRSAAVKGMPKAYRGSKQNKKRKMSTESATKQKPGKATTQTVCGQKHAESSGPKMQPAAMAAGLALVERARATVANSSRMCEDCGQKFKNYGTVREWKRRWCGVCAKKHGAGEGLLSRFCANY
eukprot:SAG31_NODE_6331_length_2062_cov_7.328069_1_plen_216_part_00